MTNKEKPQYWIIPAFLVLLIVVLGVGYYALKTEDNEKESNILINFSDKQYSALDFQNVTYNAFDSDGNKISGKDWFGVNGIYSNQKPLIFGTNEYSYWIENKSYYISPEILTPDIFHRNQSIILNVIKKENLSSVIIQGFDRYGFILDNEISFVPSYGEFNKNVENANFNLRFYDFIPTKSFLIFEADNNFLEIECNLPKTFFPETYAMESVNSRSFVYEISNDLESDCLATRTKKEFHQGYEYYDKIKVTILPNDYHLTKEKEMELNYIDENYNPLTKPIFEGKIKIR